MRPQSRERRVALSVTVSPLLRRELEIEAWEEQLALGAYVRKLLSSRGKFARTVGRSGGYLLAAPSAIRPIEAAKAARKKK